MKCSECNSAARFYNGQDLSNSKYTYCSLVNSGIYKYGNYNGSGWRKVFKNSQPSWCPRKEY